MSDEHHPTANNQEHQRLLAALRESEILRELAELLASSLDLNFILQVLVKRTTEVCNVGRCAVWLLEDTQQTFQPVTYHLSSQHLNSENVQAADSIWYRSPMPTSDPLMQRLLKGKGLLIIEDLQAEPSGRKIAETFLVRSILLIALIREGRPVGMMSLDNPGEIRTFSPELQQLARAIGQQAAIAIDNARLYQQAQALAAQNAQFLLEARHAATIATEQAKTLNQEAINARTNEAVMRETNALKDEFLAITAHEFRTPLTIILAHSQIALRTLRRTEDQKQTQSLIENLSTIEEQTRLLTNIVSTFLEVTQINRGQLALNLEEINLAEIAQQVVADHSATSPNHSIRCTIEPASQPYLVKGDSARLLQVLANLVQNAIKYSPYGGPITVSLGQHTNGQGASLIEVCVADKGIGVPKDAQAHLFERFYRAPNIEGNKARGIGLGLYVVAQLLQMHGGTIHVESSNICGEGSRFILTLPLLEGNNTTRA